MSHSRSQITEPKHRQWNLGDHPEHFGPNTGTQVPPGVPDVYGRRSCGITMMMAHERKQRDYSMVHFPGGIRASEVQRPTTGRVSSESNHVDMRRDRVVEGILSGGPSLADSFPIARIDNGPNAAINLQSNPPFQLVTQCSLLRLSECSGQSRLCFGCKLKLQQDIHTQLKHAAAPCFLSQVLRSIPKICVISFCNRPRPLVTQAPCTLFNVQPTSSCRQPCHIGYPRRCQVSRVGGVIQVTLAGGNPQLEPME
ncbi:uncharacterized protein FMAN_01743 [Fusarium mangiferae]|uniref:Uncharacterized protein n=1 Tax=Fusarium mangiferae TaxID=192010 RepID=A0A1L7SNP0_FUSMA|nr:uncharacterized protein FMAN_01743 [Fusarium mangiferae]CVK84816.1 uncharacterized protein FMAN_01743 [Fusarium mangiferae]